MDRTGIEWTDATWNPVTGCSKVSAGCDHCYAETIAERFRGGVAYPQGFDLTLRPHKLLDPIRWSAPRRIFVNSMSDLFHEEIPDDYVARVFATMALAPWHVYQILTKRPGRMRRLVADPGFAGDVFVAADAITSTMSAAMRRRVAPDPFHRWPLASVWLGVSVENTATLSRAKVLAKTPAATRFLSCEPLLGPVDLGPLLATGAIAWVIDGGESGAGRRPADVAWFRQIRDACLDAGVAYLHKQGNAFAPGRDRELDGRTWDQYPGAPDGRDRAKVHRIHPELVEEVV